MKNIWTLNENKFLYGLKLLWQSEMPLVIVIKVGLLVLIFALFLKQFLFFYRHLQLTKSFLELVKMRSKFFFLKGGAGICELFLLKSMFSFIAGFLLLGIVGFFVQVNESTQVEAWILALVVLFFIWAFLYFIFNEKTKNSVENRAENRLKTQEQSQNCMTFTPDFALPNGGLCKDSDLFSHREGLRENSNDIIVTTTVNSPLPRSKMKKDYDKKFYESRQWRELRFQILKSHGRRCALCHTTEGVFHVDHIKPRSKYPHLELEPSNLQVLCEDCNLGKTDNDDGKNNFNLLKNETLHKSQVTRE